jgi:hypothetical protein
MNCPRNCHGLRRGHRKMPRKSRYNTVLRVLCYPWGASLGPRAPPTFDSPSRSISGPLEGCPSLKRWKTVFLEVRIYRFTLLYLTALGLFFKPYIGLPKGLPDTVSISDGESYFYVPLRRCSILCSPHFWCTSPCGRIIPQFLFACTSSVV